MPPLNKSTSLKKSPQSYRTRWNYEVLLYWRWAWKWSLKKAVTSSAKKTQTYVPESLLPKQIRSPQHPFFRTFIPMPFSTNYSSPNFVKILTQLHRQRKWRSIESSQTHLKVTIDRAFWLVNCQKRHRAKESLILLASHEGIGFGFTTPFGWLVYLLWFWFYDSQVKTALKGHVEIGYLTKFGALRVWQGSSCDSLNMVKYPYKHL